jgi:hypothetical protein
LTMFDRLRRSRKGMRAFWVSARGKSTRRA